MNELILISVLFFLLGVMFAFVLVEVFLFGDGGIFAGKVFFGLSVAYVLVTFYQLKAGIEAFEAYIAISVLIVFNVAYVLLRMRGRKVS